MKTGKSLVQLAQEIERRANAKHDMVASTKVIKVEPNQQEGADVDPSAIQIAVGSERFGVNDVAHRQIGEYTGVPAVYYDRMKTESPNLLADNVNHWLVAKPENRMVRTLDGRARAFLSDRFRPLENEDLGEAVIPVLLDMDLAVVSCEITDRRLYIKAVDKRIMKDIPTGKALGDGTHTIFDTMSPAITISNSEVGLGSLSVVAGVFTKGCTNLAFFSDRAMRKYHVGGRHEITEQFQALLSDKTQRLTNAAVWAQVRDVVKGAFEQARFEALVDEKVLGMARQPIGADADVVKVVKLASRRLGITETEEKSVLKHLIEGGDLSRYGVFNAVTRTAQDVDDYDRASDLERAGGAVIDLTNREWEVIAEAA